MPRPRVSIPKLARSFSVSEAQSLGVGAGAGVLRHSRFQTPFVGVRSLTEPLDAGRNLAERVSHSAMLLLPRLRPGEVVSHHSALLIYGCPIRAREELHITAQPTHTRSRARGVVGHRFSANTQTSMHRGVPIVTPATALLQAAGYLPLREIVVAIDHLIRPNGYQPALADPEALRMAIGQFRGRGARVLQTAVGLATARNESRMETLTWLMLTAFCLTKGVELQVDLEDDKGWIGRFDFVHGGKKLIIEYDGEQHRTSRAQYAHDLRRLDRARAAGYLVIRLLAEDVLETPQKTAARIALLLGIVAKPHPMLLDLLPK
ncbi:MAG: DUF559 domain-containing protein [Leucobacter sp.]